MKRSNKPSVKHKLVQTGHEQLSPVQKSLMPPPPLQLPGSVFGELPLSRVPKSQTAMAAYKTALFDAHDETISKLLSVQTFPLLCSNHFEKKCFFYL